MLLILKCRRVGSKIYRISYKSTGVADQVRQGGQISGGELRRWLKFDSWSLREAALLSCGQRPGRTNRARTIGRVTKKFAGNPDAVARKTIPTELDEMKDLIRRARNGGIFGDPVKPAVFIEWLREKQPDARLLRILEEDARRHGTTQTALPSQPLSPHLKAAEANKLGTSYKILLAFAVKYTNYNIHDNKSSIDKIMKVLSDCGMDPGRDTVKKHLREAYDRNVDALKGSTMYVRKK